MNKKENLISILSMINKRKKYQHMKIKQVFSTVIISALTASAVIWGYNTYLKTYFIKVIYVIILDTILSFSLLNKLKLRVNNL